MPAAPAVFRMTMPDPPPPPTAAAPAATTLAYPAGRNCSNLPVPTSRRRPGSGRTWSARSLSPKSPRPRSRPWRRALSGSSGSRLSTSSSPVASGRSGYGKARREDVFVPWEYVCADAAVNTRGRRHPRDTPGRGAGEAADGRSVYDQRRAGTGGARPRPGHRWRWFTSLDVGLASGGS